MSIYYLDRHPPASMQRRSPRREALSGVVGVHTAENRPDYLAPDDGAEAVAHWITQRADPGSYHRLFDSDSTVALMPWSDEAFGDGTGTNRHAIHISFATRADQWPTKPKAWRDAALQRAALSAVDFALHIKRERGSSFMPPARRITGDQARNRVPGFVAHGDLDPGRRSDPGAGFPWDQFLALYAYFLSQQGAVRIPETFVQFPLYLTPGDRGQPIADLQALLRFWWSPGLAVDGLFGPSTATAAQGFKTTLRGVAVDPSLIGDNPIWGFAEERTYGRFLTLVEAMGA